MFKKIAAILSAYAIFAVSVFATCATVTVNGQCLYTDAAPTISACGNSPTASATSSSNAGVITVGTSPTDNYGHFLFTTQCTLTFATAFTAAPVVTVSSNQRGMVVGVLQVSTTAVTLTFSKDAGTTKFSYSAI